MGLIVSKFFFLWKFFLLSFIFCFYYRSLVFLLIFFSCSSVVFASYFSVSSFCCFVERRLPESFHVHRSCLLSFSFRRFSSCSIRCFVRIYFQYQSLIERLDLG